MRVASLGIQWWPVELNLRTARLVGKIWYHCDRRHRNRAIANLQRSFPTFTPRQCDRIARKSLQHMFMIGMEVLFTTRLIRVDTWRRYVQLDNFHETLELLMTSKKGMVLLTGHYGNWEILGYVLATLGFETTSIARRLDNPLINDWLFGVREERGQKVIDKKGATDEITQTLGDGKAVAFVADQNAGSKGIFVDFFGRKASTYKSIGLVAMQYECPVVIGYARRQNNHFKFKVATQDIIWPADWKDQADPLRYITQRYTKAIEDMVRADPTQYLWMHRRWKSRPKGEVALEYD
jgi:KDO2-lipid IV(A) lauroyltransferase